MGLAIQIGALQTRSGQDETDGPGLRRVQFPGTDGGHPLPHPDRRETEAIGEAGGNEGILLLPPGTVFVGIGLSNLDLRMESLDTDVALGNRKDNLNQVLGSVYLGDLKMVMDGTVKIHVQLKHRLHFRPGTSFTLFQLRITLFILKSMEPRT